MGSFDKRLGNPFFRDVDQLAWSLASFPHFSYTCSANLPAMLSGLFKNVNFRGVIIIVLCASTAYGVASWLITNNTIAYSTIPGKVSLLVHDDKTDKDVRLYFPAESSLPADSVEQAFGKNVFMHSPGKSNIFLYHQNPTLLVWVFLVCAMISIAAGSVPVFVRQIVELRRKFSLETRHIWYACLYAGLLCAFLVFSNTKLPGYYDPPSIFRDLHLFFKTPNLPEWVVISTVALILPALIVVFLIGVCSDHILAHTKQLNDDSDKQLTADDIEDAAKKMRLLHKALQNVLQVLAVIVVFSVLTSSALGASIRAAVKIEGFDLYPAEVSLVYGMYFSLFLCIIYLPVYYYIKQNYLPLKAYAIDVHATEELKAKSWYKDLTEDSKFEGNAIENIKVALTMLAPLLTAFLPETLHLIK